MALSKPDEKNIIIKIKDDNDNFAAEDQEEQKNMENHHHVSVTSHLYIKPSHSKQTLDKEVVLRRIRQRKLMNNVKSALQSFLGSSMPAKMDNNKVSVHGIKWVDDAFAAL